MGTAKECGARAPRRCAAPQTQKTIVRALRVEIVKPVSHTWDEAGTTLRTIRSVAHRLYTAAALAAIEADRANRKGRAGIAVHPQTAAYRAVAEEVVEIQEWASVMLRKKGSGEALERLSVLELPGGMKASIGSVAFTGFSRWRKAKQKERVPTWKHGAPIPSRAQDSSLCMDESGAALLTVKLTPKGKHTFVVKAGRGSHWGRLRALASGDPGMKMGETKLTYSVRQKKWFAFIAYSEPAWRPPEELDENHVMVLHRGQRNLLVASTNHGRYKVIATGNRLRDVKRKTAARRRAVQETAVAERGKGRRGHGRARRYAINDRLSEAEANYIKTLCQQIAARSVQLAKAWGCGSVFIEDYGGIEPSAERGKRMYLERFPNYELKQSVAWAFKKAGVIVQEYPHENISNTCPRCGNVDSRQHNLRTGVFHCRACAFDRDSDWVAAVEALRRVTADGTAGTHDKRLAAEERMVERVRKGEGA